MAANNENRQKNLPDKNEGTNSKDVVLSKGKHFQSSEMMKHRKPYLYKRKTSSVAFQEII